MRPKKKDKLIVSTQKYHKYIYRHWESDFPTNIRDRGPTKNEWSRLLNEKHCMRSVRAIGTAYCITAGGLTPDPRRAKTIKNGSTQVSFLRSACSLSSSRLMRKTVVGERAKYKEERDRKKTTSTAAKRQPPQHKDASFLVSQRF